MNIIKNILNNPILKTMFIPLKKEKKSKKIWMVTDGKNNWVPGKEEKINGNYMFQFENSPIICEHLQNWKECLFCRASGN